MVQIEWYLANQPEPRWCRWCGRPINSGDDFMLGMAQIDGRNQVQTWVHEHCLAPMQAQQRQNAIMEEQHASHDAPRTSLSARALREAIRQEQLTITTHTVLPTPTLVEPFDWEQQDARTARIEQRTDICLTIGAVLIMLLCLAALTVLLVNRLR